MTTANEAKTPIDLDERRILKEIRSAGEAFIQADNAYQAAVERRGHAVWQAVEHWMMLGDESTPEAQNQWLDQINQVTSTWKIDAADRKAWQETMIQAGMSQSQRARMLGVSQQVISKDNVTSIDDAPSTRVDAVGRVQPTSKPRAPKPAETAPESQPDPERLPATITSITGEDVLMPTDPKMVEAVELAQGGESFATIAKTLGLPEKKVRTHPAVRAAKEIGAIPEVDEFDAETKQRITEIDELLDDTIKNVRLSVAHRVTLLDILRDYTKKIEGMV